MLYNRLSMGKVIKKILLFVTYIWLRFDPIIRLAFGKSWTPRYEFMSTIFGEADSEDFLKKRVKLVKKRKKKPAPLILPSNVKAKTQEFLQTKQSTKTGLITRKRIINKLTFWALNQEINAQNIDSSKTRSQIVKALLGSIFQNSLADETTLILESIKKIVFSRVTYLGAKGEPSPDVHNHIIAGVGKVLNMHFSEAARIQHIRLQDLTKVKLIKEIKKSGSKAGTGSLAFSGGYRQDDPYRHKFPLSDVSVQMLISILKHYQFSSWPDSREAAQKLIEQIERKIGFALDTI